MNDTIQAISRPLAQSNFWMKLLGVLLIIYGVLMALTIVGLLIAWLPIWLGVMLFQSASAATQASQSGDEATLIRALEKLQTYFTIMGILALIGLLLVILGTVAGGMMGAMMGAMPHPGGF